MDERLPRNTNGSIQRGAVDVGSMLDVADGNLALPPAGAEEERSIIDSAKWRVRRVVVKWFKLHQTVALPWPASTSTIELFP